MKRLLLKSAMIFASVAALVMAGENLVTAGKGWTPTTDEIGSSLDTGSVMIKDNILKVEFTIAKKTTEEWPYVELISAIGKSMETVKALELTYKCDKPLIIKLSQSDFSWNGSQSYAHYEYTVPAASKWSTVTVSLKKFEQPEWTPVEDKQVGLKLENVKEVYFTPQLDVGIGESSTVELKSFKVVE